MAQGRISAPTGQGTLTPHADIGCVPAGAGVPDTTFLVHGVKGGRVFELTADAGPWNDDFDVAFHADVPGCDATTRTAPLNYTNRAGDERSVVPAGAEYAMVRLVTGSPGAAFTFRVLPKDKVRLPPPSKRKPTVVAVLEPSASTTDGPNGFSPYHLDFMGDRHPWNQGDVDEEDVFDAYADPLTYLPDYPSNAVPVQLSLPTTGDEQVADLWSRDKAAWAEMLLSTATTTNVYRLPGTKIVGAVRFGSSSTTAGNILNAADSSASVNDFHATKSASMAVGNQHGTCAECVAVLVLFDSGANDAALDWVARQSWIDVVSNSWGALPLTPRGPRRPPIKPSVPLWNEGKVGSGPRATVPTERA